MTADIQLTGHSSKNVTHLSIKNEHNSIYYLKDFMG